MNPWWTTWQKVARVKAPSRKQIRMVGWAGLGLVCIKAGFYPRRDTRETKKAPTSAETVPPRWKQPLHRYVNDKDWAFLRFYPLHLPVTRRCGSRYIADGY